MTFKSILFKKVRFFGTFRSHFTYLPIDTILPYWMVERWICLRILVKTHIFWIFSWFLKSWKRKKDFRPIFKGENPSFLCLLMSLSKAIYHVLHKLLHKYYVVFWSILSPLVQLFWAVLKRGLLGVVLRAGWHLLRLVDSVRHGACLACLWAYGYIVWK